MFKFTSCCGRRLNIRYIVLSIKNCYFHTYVDSINPSKLEIKDTKKYAPSVSYLDILLKRDIDSNLTTKHDKRNDFNL